MKERRAGQDPEADDNNRTAELALDQISIDRQNVKVSMDFDGLLAKEDSISPLHKGSPHFITGRKGHHTRQKSAPDSDQYLSD